MKLKAARATRRRRRVRSQIAGTATRPRLAVSRSLQHISAQLIDDATGVTLVAAHDRGIKGTKTERAAAVGKKIAELAVAKKITVVVFDRGGRQYHGRVAALATAARENGLQF
ncbi:MAG: 50S ribosomal protein L18 [Patescibacteria group bacterium]